jgi:hypothetical protein
LRGNKKGCEYAKARVICGGVAISSGDFWCTKMVDLCLLADVACERVTGEKEAVVGGFGSLAWEVPSSSFLEFGVFDIKSNQGVSWWRRQYCHCGVIVSVVVVVFGTYKCCHGNVISKAAQGLFATNQ